MTPRLSQRASEFVRAGSKRLSLEGRAELYNANITTREPTRCHRRPSKILSGASGENSDGAPRHGRRRLGQVVRVCLARTHVQHTTRCGSRFVRPWPRASVRHRRPHPPSSLPLLVPWNISPSPSLPFPRPGEKPVHECSPQQATAPGANLLQAGRSPARPHSAVASDSFPAARSRAGPGRGRAPSSFLRPIPPQSRSVRPTMQQEAGLPLRRCER